MSVGYGMPWWLPDEYLTADETRALGEVRLGGGMFCLRCGNPPDWRGLEGAHVCRKGMGGKPQGSTGPTAELCYTCHHTDLDERPATRTLAIRRDGALCWLERTGMLASTQVECAVLLPPGSVRIG